VRKKLRLGVAALAAVVATAAFVNSSPANRPATSTAGFTASGDCSKTTALEVAKPQFVWGSDVSDPIRQVLCGPFTGPGSDAMAVTFTAPTCWPVQSWAVYRFTAGVWQLVLNQPAYLTPPLVAVGSDIRETTAVHRAGDARCLPSGGTQARIWHWDGQQLVAGAWKQVTPGAAATFAEFFSPSRNVACDMGDRSGRPAFLVFCRSELRQLSVTLSPNGGLYICRGTTGHPCIGHPARSSPSLAYGKQITVGRFRCLSLRTGISCTVVRSEKGFLINGKAVRRVGS
jgi:hypothetical protein